MTLMIGLGLLLPIVFSVITLRWYVVTGCKPRNVALLSEPETISCEVWPFQLSERLILLLHIKHATIYKYNTYEYILTKHTAIIEDIFMISSAISLPFGLIRFAIPKIFLLHNF